MKKSSDGKPLVEIKNLNVWFGSVHAVKNVSLEIASASITALVGGSGSGKTVTALSVCRLLDKEARVDGQILFEAGSQPARGKEVSYVFQDPATSLNPVIKIKHQMLEVSPSRDLTRARELLLACKLTDVDRVLEAYPHELSGGMKQRVMIAMALLAGARLLIADEPTTALDVTTQSEIIKLLLELRHSRNLTLLFITHDLYLASKIADVIYVMERGEVAEVLQRETGFTPHSAYGKRLFNARLTENTPPKTMIPV